MKEKTGKDKMQTLVLGFLLFAPGWNTDILAWVLV